jgi:hypothetical protein
MKTTFTSAFIFGMIMNVSFSSAQVSTGFNFGSGTDYVGWDINQAFPLTIQHEAQQPINFYTDAGSGSLNNLRMFIQGNDGHVGIGNFATANTLLHLHQAIDDIRTVNFQMTNSVIGNGVDDGFLIDVDHAGVVALRQQEQQANNKPGLKPGLVVFISPSHS